MFIEEYAIFIILLTIMFIVAFITKHEMFWVITIILSMITIYNYANYWFLGYSILIFLISVTLSVYDMFIKYAPEVILKEDNKSVH